MGTLISTTTDASSFSHIPGFLQAGKPWKNGPSTFSGIKKSISYFFLFTYTFIRQ